MHALISLFEAAANVLTGNFGLIHSRYSARLAELEPSVWYDSRAGLNPYHFNPKKEP
jgi:hypothetical protein